MAEWKLGWVAKSFALAAVQGRKGLHSERSNARGPHRTRDAEGVPGYRFPCKIVVCFPSGAGSSAETTSSEVPVKRLLIQLEIVLPKAERTGLVSSGKPIVSAVFVSETTSAAVDVTIPMAVARSADALMSPMRRDPSVT